MAGHLDAMSVIVFGFIWAKYLARRQAKHLPRLPAERLITWGLVCYSVAFMMVPLGIMYAQWQHTNLILLGFPAALFILAAAGEIFVNITLYSLVGELIAPKFQGLFMGYMFLNIAVGNQLSGPFSNLIVGGFHSLSTNQAAQTNPLYLKMFVIMSIVSLLCAMAYQRGYKKQSSPSLR